MPQPTTFPSTSSSSHAYDDEPVQRLLGTDEVIPQEDRTCAAVAKVRRQIEASAHATSSIALDRVECSRRS